MEKIRIGIIGFGNIGKSVSKVILNNPDMELVGIFSRRSPEGLPTKVPAFHIDSIQDFKNKIDVVILCNGSATDLPKQGPEIASMFNVVDSFDTHAKIPEYFESMNTSSTNSRKISIISTGWDPGFFSINRLFGEAFLPNSKTYTFWGPGVSQGHSQAVRSIKGVVDAIQYTIPIEESLEVIRNGDTPDFSTREKHERICYIVSEENADRKAIEEEIKNMPNYFVDYNTIVHFISMEEFDKSHRKMSHGGFVITSGYTTPENNQIMELSIKLDSNPEFTASIMIAYARAAYKLSQKGEFGSRTVFDIAPSLLSPKSSEQLRKEIL